MSTFQEIQGNSNFSTVNLRAIAPSTTRSGCLPAPSSFLLLSSLELSGTKKSISPEVSLFQKSNLRLRRRRQTRLPPPTLWRGGFRCRANSAHARQSRPDSGISNVGDRRNEFAEWIVSCTELHRARSLLLLLYYSQP